MICIAKAPGTKAWGFSCFTAVFDKTLDITHPRRLLALVQLPGAFYDMRMERRVFRGLMFRKINRAKNQNRVYALLWQENLFGEWELVRTWGRAGTDMRRTKAAPYPDLQAAWPEIRRVVRKRIRHGYRAAPLR